MEADLVVTPSVVSPSCQTASYLPLALSSCSPPHSAERMPASCSTMLVCPAEFAGMPRHE